MFQASPTARARKYTGTAIALHWIVATLIIGGFALGWVMTDIPGFTPTKLRYFSWHKWIGCTVFVLVIARFLWRLTHRPPELPPNMSSQQKRAAEVAHVILYMLMFAVPITGYFYSSAANIQVIYLGIVPLPKLIEPNPVLRPLLRNAHVYLNYALLAMFTIHLLAALKHHFVDRDGLLFRMLPFIR